MQDPVSVRQRVRYTPPSRTYMPQPPDAGEEVGPYQPLRPDMEQLLGLSSSPVPVNPVPRRPTRAEAWPQQADRLGDLLLRSHQPLGITPDDMSYFSDPRYGWDNQMGIWRMKHPPSKAARVPFSPLYMPGDRTFAEGLRALDDGNSISVTLDPMTLDPVTQKIRHRDKTLADFHRWYSTLPDHVKRQNANTGPPPFDFDAVMVHQQHRDEVRERMRKAAPGSEDAKNLANFLRQDAYSVEPAMGSTIPSLMAVGSGVGPAAMMGLQGSPVTSGTRSRTPSSAVVRDESAIPAAEEARYLANSGLQYGGRSPTGAIAGMLAGLGPTAGVLAGSPFTMTQDFGPAMNAETLRRELKQQNPGVAGDDVEGGIYRRTMDKYLRRVLAGTSDPAVRQRLQSDLDALRKEQDVYGPPTESRQDQLDRAMSDTAQHLEGLLSWIATDRPMQNQKAGDLRASMMGVPEFDRSYFAQDHPDFWKITPEQRKTIMMDAQRRGTHGDAILNRRPVPSPEEIATYRSRNPNADMNPVRNRAHLSGGALSPDSPYVTGGANTPTGLLPGSIDATPSGWYERYQRDQALAQLDANDERLQAPGGHDEFYLNRTRAMLDGSETETDAYKGTLRYADDPMQSRRRTYGMQSERFVGPGNREGTYGTNRLGALRALNQTGQLAGNTGLQNELRSLEGAAEASAQAKRDSLPARKAAAAERAAAKKNKTLERRNRAALVRAVNAGVLPATALTASNPMSGGTSVPAVLATNAPNTAQNQQDRAVIRNNLVTGVRGDGTPMSPFLSAVAQNRSVDPDDPTSVLTGAHSYMLESGTDLGEEDVLDLWTYMRASTDDGYWVGGRYGTAASSYQEGPAFFQIMQDLRRVDSLSTQQKQSFAKRLNALRGKAKRTIEDDKARYQDVPMYPTFN